MFDVTQPGGPGRVSCSFSVTSDEDDVEVELSDDLLSCDSALEESGRGVAPLVRRAGAALFVVVAKGLVSLCAVDTAAVVDVRPAAPGVAAFSAGRVGTLFAVSGVTSFWGLVAPSVLGETSKDDTGRGFFTIEYCDERATEDAGASFDATFKAEEAGKGVEVAPDTLTAFSGFLSAEDESGCFPALAIPGKAVVAPFT